MIELLLAPMIGIGFYVACSLLARALQLVRRQADLLVQDDLQDKLEAGSVKAG